MDSSNSLHPTHRWREKSYGINGSTTAREGIPLEQRKALILARQGIPCRKRKVSPFSKRRYPFSVGICDLAQFGGTRKEGTCCTALRIPASQAEYGDMTRKHFKFCCMLVERSSNDISEPWKGTIRNKTSTWPATLVPGA